jgi:acetylornithine/succinyldiaminopimelate/putrescine aminotransferase
LSGLLAEAITKRTPPHLDAVFFCNSGTEAMEGALKFARAATGRKRAVSLASAFHGLSLGALSLMGCESFTEGFGPLMQGFDARVPLDDLEALDRELRSRDVAAFVIETVQGKGCQTPKTDFFVRAQELCRRYGTLFISDEVQTGLGRTGKMFGFQHWDLAPDIITLAKTLSGGYVPCGAIVALFTRQPLGATTWQWPVVSLRWKSSIRKIWSTARTRWARYWRKKWTRSARSIRSSKKSEAKVS